MGDTYFASCPAPPTLAGAVRELWILDDDGCLSAGLPKPYAEIVVSLTGTHWWRASPEGAEHRYVDSWVTPIQRGPRYARATGRRHLIGARLEPWAAVRLFGSLPPGDGTPPPRLAQLLGEEAAQLRARLIAAPTDRERFTRLAAWLEAQPALHAPGQQDTGSLRRLASVKALAKAMLMAPRSLRRHFVRDAGLAPKSWLTLHRLDAVLRDPALSDQDQALVEIALEHGYADQAHFSREVARLTGATPTVLRRRSRHLPPHLLPRT